MSPAYSLGGVVGSLLGFCPRYRSLPGVISQVVSSPHYYPPQATQGQLLQPSPSDLSPWSLMVPTALPPFRMATNNGQAQQPTPTHTWSAQAHHVYSGHMCLSQPTPSSLRAPHAFSTSSPHLKVSLVRESEHYLLQWTVGTMRAGSSGIPGIPMGLVGSSWAGGAQNSGRGEGSKVSL